MFDEQRNAGLRLPVERHIHREKSRHLELQLLDIDDEIPGPEVHIVRQRDFHWDLNGRHDGVPVGIYEVEFQLPFALVAGEKRHAQRHGTLWMNGGQFARINGVERAEEVEFAVVIGRCVTENRGLNVHAAARLAHEAPE